MIRRPRFRRSLRVEVISPDLVAFLSESKESYLRGRLFPLLVPFIDGTRTLAELAAELDGRANLMDVRFGIEVLAEQGHVVEATEEDSAGWVEAAFFSGFEPSAARGRLAEAAVAVRSLCAERPEAWISTFESLDIQVRSDAEMSVVLVDDYLAPELEEQDRQARTAGSWWLPIKPSGEVPWIGPIFRSGGACWSCLARRLRENRPLRELLERQGGIEAAPPSPPIAPVSELARNLVTTALAARFADGHPGPFDDAVVTFDPWYLKLERHPAPRDPRCEVCGDPRLPLPAAGTPHLEGPEKVLSVDGGYRSVPPDETIERLDRLRSPLTGIIGEVRVRTNSGARLVVAEHLCAAPGGATDEAAALGKRWCAGKGLTHSQQEASALSEAVERYSGAFKGDEPRRKARLAELGEDAVHPASCLRFSDRQYRERQRLNTRGIDRLWIPEPFDENLEIDWTPLWSLTAKRRRFVPTAYCYYAFPAGEGSEPCRADSNGCAAGNTLAEAVLQGFFELVERDSIALWWYNRIPRPRVDVASFGEPQLDHIGQVHAAARRELRVFDITCDLEVPTFAAVSLPLDDPDAAPLFGFGTHADPAIALARALTEVQQFLPGAIEGAGRPSLSGPLRDADFLWSRDLPCRGRADYAVSPPADLAATLADCVATAARRGLEVLVLDQTRPEVGFPVVRVVVPGLRHFWARLGPGRLYTVPVSLGWLETARDEESLNPCHILI